MTAAGDVEHGADLATAEPPRARVPELLAGFADARTPQPRGTRVLTVLSPLRPRPADAGESG